MIREEKIILNEFKEIFGEEDTNLWFNRFIKQVLDPYFKLENSKDILLKFIEIIKNDLDLNNKYTILKTKPYQFKTSFQEEYGFDAKPYENCPITISEFRNSNNNYDLISDYRFFKFYNENNFNKFNNFINKNYDFLKNLELYNLKQISLKELKEYFVEEELSFDFER
jgi:hypothetical protein